MESCKNCFSPIEDMRKETRCATCDKPLHKDCAINDGGTFCDVCYTIKGEDAIVKDTEIIIPDVIRRSYIELYDSCPYAFYLAVLKGLDTTTSIFAQIGIDLHDMFHKACLGEFKSAKDMINAYYPMYERYKDELFEADLHLYKDMTVEKLKKKLWQQSIDAIDTFFSILPTLPKQAFTLEETIEFSVGEDLPKVSITMDRVDEIDGELEVRDWKTGSVIVGQKISSDLQAPLYIKAIAQHFKKRVRKFVFNYLPENKTRTFERIDDDNYVCVVNKREYKINLTDAIKEVQRRFAQIKKGNFNVPTDSKKMYFKCKTCTFKRCGTCQGADLEGWKQYN